MKEKYGKLTLKERVEKRSKKHKRDGKWLCQCECGNEKIVSDYYLRMSPFASCGCLLRKNNKDYDESIRNKIKNGIKIDSNNCWIWQGAKHLQGYGNIAYRGKPLLVHRISWMIFKGEIPQGMKVCHKCDVTSCCNPEHLFLGSQKDNVKDGIDKGRYANRVLGKRRNKLIYEQVQEIKKLHEEGMTRKELQIKYEIGRTCIQKIITGKSWKINWSQEI